MVKWAGRIFNTLLAAFFLAGIVQMCYSNELATGPGADGAEGAIAGAVAAQ